MRCRKKRFRDRIAALMALEKIQAWGSDRGTKPIRAYHCPHCGGWHLTSQEFKTKEETIGT